MRGQVLVEMAVNILGSPAGVAAALDVNITTVNRWIRGAQDITGTGKVAIMAIIKHPGEYAHHRVEPCRPGRKPSRVSGQGNDIIEQKGD